jgi:hypothetical protein
MRGTLTAFCSSLITTACIGCFERLFRLKLNGVYTEACLDIRVSLSLVERTMASRDSEEPEDGAEGCTEEGTLRICVGYNTRFIVVTRKSAFEFLLLRYAHSTHVRRGDVVVYLFLMYAEFRVDSVAVTSREGIGYLGMLLLVRNGGRIAPTYYAKFEDGAQVLANCCVIRSAPKILITPSADNKGILGLYG